MSIDNLQSDLAANLESLRNLSPLTTASDLVDHLKNTLWPTIENIVKEIGEQDECIEDMLNNAEDILQPDTAQVFAQVIAVGLVLANTFEAALKSANAVDPKVAAVIKKFRELAKTATDTLAEITVAGGGEEGEPEEDEDEDEDEDEEDDEDEDEEEGDE